VSKDFVTLGWESPDTDGGAPLTGFIVERKDVTKASWVSAGRCEPDTFQFRVTKLIEGNEYEFQVAAENEVGQSDWATLDKPVKAKLGFGIIVVPNSLCLRVYRTLHPANSDLGFNINKRVFYLILLSDLRLSFSTCDAVISFASFTPRLHDVAG